MAILGIDEVGRGPLAGPLVVGAVILPEEKKGVEWISVLRDSKKLSFKRREILSEMIIKNAPACGLGWVEVDELNEIGMIEGLRLATRRAVEMVQKQKVKFSQIVIDGNINFLSGTALEPYTTTIIKGDDKVKEISAASIIAKVARDRYMIELSDTYPDYGFERHMGYGTRQHVAALKQFGPCEEHRTFCRPVAEVLGNNVRHPKKKKKNTTKVGRAGEEAVAKFLEEQGHKIVAKNYKTKTAEVDIISTRGMTIYFTEVKTRGSGNGLEAIDSKKLDKMRLGAETFMFVHFQYADFDPVLAAASVDGNNRVLEWMPLYD